MSDALFSKYGRSAKAGEVLFTEGEAGAEMFVVRSGQVRVFVGHEGAEKTLALLGAGEFIGEMSLLTGQPRTATAVVEKDAELVVVGGRVLEEMIVQNTEIALRLVRKLARRLQAADSLIAVLVHRGANERVIENLKRLAVLHRGTAPGPVVLDADYEGMAEQVGMEVSEVREVMSRIVRSGAVAEEDGAWSIDKPEDLGEVLGLLKLKEQYK